MATVRWLVVLVFIAMAVGMWLGSRSPETTPIATVPATATPSTDNRSPAPALSSNLGQKSVPVADATGFPVLTSLHEGDTIRFSLPGGRAASGTVNLVQHDTGGVYRVGGSLEMPASGSFVFGTDGRTTGGLVQIPSRRRAFTLKQDAAGQLSFQQRPLDDVVCLPLPKPNFEPEKAPSLARGAAAAIPLLSSRPTAAAVIYLDFDGQRVTDPSWNNGRPIEATAPNVTSTDITQIWRRVKEDFWPFDIDITTDLSRYDNAEVGKRMRCIITPTETAAPGAGGVAYVDSFSDAGTPGTSSTIPCWVFNTSVTGISEAISHEVGHTLGLHHDGRTSPSEEYYAGQGTGATGWAPIMGVGYYKSLVQWSKGEYLNANRTEDDLAIISRTANGFGYVADEAGDTTATAASLAVDDTDVNQPGIITSANDKDVYVFACGAGTVSVNASPAPLSPNLDIVLDLLDESGAVLVTNNPVSSLPASISTSVTAGTYYLRIRGTGAGNVLTTGYTPYGSIGEYTIAGTIPAATPEPKITSAGSAEGEQGLPFSYQILATHSPTSYGILGTLPTGLTLDSDTGLLAGTPTATGAFNLTLQATNGDGTGSKPFVLTIQAAGTPALTSASSAQGFVGLNFGFQLTATHTPSQFGVTGTLPTGISLNPDTGLVSGSTTQAGKFLVTVSASNANGTGTAPLTITIVNAVIPLNQALDVPGRAFSNPDGAAWSGQNAITFDGVDAAQSAPIAHDGITTMETTVTGPVTISFRYRIDSQQNFDKLDFSIDSISQLNVSGFVDWTLYSTAVPAGNHRLRWTYSKDGSGSAGADAAWVDALGITSATAPVITSPNFASARVNVPFSYQITGTNSPNEFGLAGTLPAGVNFATDNTGLISGTPTEGGVFTVTISASNGGGTGIRELTINVESGVLDLTGALDQLNLAWVNTGTAPWTPETDVTHDAVDAAAALNVADNQTATLETTVEGPSSLRFFWKVSSERAYDYLSFSIDGEEHWRISGEVDWELKSYPIPAGVHQITFRYRRDGSGSEGLNGAWIDQVSVFPREGLPGSDSFVGAQALTGTHVELATNDVQATTEPGELGPYGASYGHSLWWTWTAPETGTVIASTIGSKFDTILAIYRGTSLSDLHLLAGSDDVSRRDPTSRTTFKAVGGQTYFITVGGFGNANGAIDFDIHYAGRGTYLGIIQPDSGADKMAGLIQLSVTEALAYTGTVTFGGSRYSFRGSLATGSAVSTVARKNGAFPLDFTFTTDLANGDSTVNGSLTTGGQGYHFAARRRIAAVDLPILAAGAYNVLLEPPDDGTNVAYGTGAGRAVVSRRGDVRFTGALGDGQKAQQGGALTFGNVWPVFFAYPKGTGTMAGDVLFDPVAADNFTGSLRWRVENMITGTFGENVALTGAFFFKPTPTLPLLDVNATTKQVQLTFSHRDAAVDPDDPILTLDTTKSIFTGMPANATIKMNARTGLFSGYFPAPVTGRRQAFSGALLQSQNRGAGFFNAATGHGRVDLAPLP